MKVILDSKFKIVDGIKKMDFARVTAMLKDAYWSKGIGIDEVKQGAENSALVVGVFAAEGLQISYARVISDKTRFAYILDVYVDEHFRKKGIGGGDDSIHLESSQIKRCLSMVSGYADAHGLYRKFGFVPLTNTERWMEIRNPRP